MNLYRKLSAVFRSHYSLDVLDDARHRTAVIVELLGAVRDLDASLFAYEFVMRAFIDVLKAAPSAYIVDQDMVEFGMARPNIIEQLD
jgi:predicted lysophospholipase L1 biosynthesis ABC-type transport system permease subunit